MPQSLAQIYLHLVFSTKDRHPFLVTRPLQSEVHAYLAGACNNMRCPALAVGGIQDHVHILCRLARTLTVADLVRDLKKESSKWLKTKATDLTIFDWQNGYGAFSVGPSDVERVSNYIAHQEEHHRQVTFQDEYRRMLALAGLQPDERYLWD
jgi:REP element-mobilizing transposase RayT